MHFIRLAVILLVWAELSACSGFGPKMLPPTRMDYNASMASSTSEEMLINLVRLKYFEYPIFMQVGSIASVYSLGVTAGGSANFPDQRDFLRSIYATYAPNVSATYSDSPTVTYTPYQGSTYAQQLLAEFDLERLVLLYRSGWDIDYLLRVFVCRLGPLIHEYDNRTGFDPAVHENFKQVGKLLLDMDNRGDFDLITLSEGKDKDGKDINKRTIMQLRFSDSDESAKLGKLLGLNIRTKSSEAGKAVARIRLVAATSFLSDNGSIQDENVLWLRTRNLFRVMDVLGLGVEVPAEDLKKRKAVDLREQSKDIMDIRCAALKPENAYAAVRYGGHWFYIAKDDTRSKEVFQMLLAVFALQAGELPKNTPVLTLPLGGN